jgi:hypothetical protein
MGSGQSNTVERIQERHSTALERSVVALNRIAVALEVQNSRPPQQQPYFLSPAPIPHGPSAPPAASTASNLAAFAAISQQQ